MRLTTLIAPLSLAAGLVSAASSFSPTRPPAIPLAVRSPYLNTWLQVGSGGGNGGYLPGSWPAFWTTQTQGWTGIIRVDGTPYVWMGAPEVEADFVNQTAFEYTSTRSTFVMTVGDMVEMTVEFMSPVTPDDYKRQSLVFSYLDVSVTSLDGADHDIQVYSDCSAEFASGDLAAVVEWDYQTTEGVAYHTFSRQNQDEISESSEIPNWGTWYYSTADGEGVSFQSGADSDVRGEFVGNGVLANSVDDDFRAVRDQWPVFGLAQDLGKVGSDKISTLFTIGLTQENANQLLGKDEGLTTYPSMWKSYFSDGVEAMVWFFQDFTEASEIATELDNKVESDSLLAAGPNYLTITSLSVRQAFGGLAFTNTPDDPIVFLKEISSNSDIQTVDVIFPAMPLMLYLNPDILRFVLEPLYLNQENGHYPNKHAIHDLGTFPLARGYPSGDDEPMPLEESSNMIIMSLAYSQRADDTDYLAAHYPILEQWAAFLVDEALIPAHQLSTDDFAGPLANQTNLALKGIIGLRAMAEIALLTGRGNDSAPYYLNTATAYLEKWRELGINADADPPHTTLSYGDAASHGLLYNLYSARLLGFDDFVSRDVYDMQSDFYPTQARRFAVPLDTRASLTKTDWMMWCAAIASEATRDMFHRLVAEEWLPVTSTYRAFTDLYDADTGGYPGGITFVARPVVGGHFALLALP